MTNDGWKVEIKEDVEEGEWHIANISNGLMLVYYYRKVKPITCGCKKNINKITECINLIQEQLDKENNNAKSTINDND